MSRDIVFAPQEIGNADSIEDMILRHITLPRGEMLHICKSFIDARHKNNIKIVYRVESLTCSEYHKMIKDDEDQALPYMGRIFDPSDRPLVVGFGPAGMYAALVLAEYGLRPVIIERGSRVDKRIKDVDNVRSGQTVDPESNVQFGEGGAGTFSDGKLYTGVTSGLKAYISRVMVDNGADPSIMYDSHPHVGTDKLRDVVKGIREKIISLGGEFMFDTAVRELKISGGRITGVRTTRGDIDSRNVILAIGHSSRDTFRMLNDSGIAMESKPFSVGVRIEHGRSEIDTALYGFDTALYKNISSAPYKLACDTVTGRKLYTFCMCPGGEVVAAQSTPEAICTNGMSYSRRDLENSNSALLVPISAYDYGDGALDGMIYQEKLEHKAYLAAGSSGSAPIAYYGGLIGHSFDRTHIRPSFKPGVIETDIREIFDKDITDTITDGISQMGRKIRGFDSPDSVLTAPEARSSSPVRILRDKQNYMSLSVSGLYPCGEGAGYAGGIMSSAIDGIKCANALIENMLN